MIAPSLDLVVDHALAVYGVWLDLAPRRGIEVREEQLLVACWSAMYGGCIGCSIAAQG